MEKLIESLLTKIYYQQRSFYYQQIFLNSPLLLRHIPEPLIKFGGFEFNYHHYGRASHRECYLLGSSKVYEHVIYLNQWFLSRLMGDVNIPTDFTFAKLIKTMAHEVAHCLMFDFYPQHTQKHEDSIYKQICKELLENLENDAIVTKLQTELLALPTRK